MSLSLRATLPHLAEELSRLLSAAGRGDLVPQVPGLNIVDRCRCGDEFCAMFYTQPKPNGAYGPGHESVVLEPQRGEMVLDVVNGTIAAVEVLYRDEVRDRLLAVLP
jgi:hypothetical protein